MAIKVVLTGGPSTGKTSLIQRLDALGHECQHEISRQITLEGQKRGIDQLFLKEPLAFSRALFEGRKAQFIASEKSTQKQVFFDRGLPDVVAYMDYLDQPAPSSFLSDLDRYRYDRVFILPPWDNIYVQDNERYESFEQGKIIHGFLLKCYTKLGYIPISVPGGSIEARLDFILSHLPE